MRWELEFRLLGPLEVVHEDDLLEFGPRARRLLAALLVHVNQQVSAEQLIGAVWADRPPIHPRQALQLRIHQLRKSLPDDLGRRRLTTHRGGGSLSYLLRVHTDQLDVLQWDTHLADALAAAASSDWETAWVRFDQALGLWRGPALEELAREPFARAAAARLDAQWLTAKETQVYVGIRLGAHKDLLEELRGLVAAHPLRERFWALLILALSETGQQAEALVAYHAARHALVEQLGIEPGPLLQRLQHGVLAQHDPAHLYQLLNDLTPIPVVGPARPEPPPPAAQQDVRLVTVLASRLVAAPGGITVDHPEDARDRMAVAHRSAARVLRRYGGTVISEVPGRMLGVFGVRQGHDDDPERAVRAALELAAECATAEVQPAGGIATGDAVVTSTPVPAGTPDHIQVEGPVVHTAVSLEAGVPPGQLLVADSTRAATLGIDYEPFGEGPHQRGWWVRGVRGRTGAQVTGPNAPLVERDRELDVLAGALERSVRDAQPHLLTLISEPGLGKTRLVAELARHLDTVPELITWRCGRSLPFGQGRWGALAEILNAHLGILEGDPADIVDAKVRKAVSEISEPAQAQATARALQAVLATTWQPQSAPPPAGFLASCQQFLAALAAHRPLVVVFEDLHCADDALLDFVEGLPLQAEQVPLAVVATTRPELMDRRPGWGRGSCNTITLALKPLSDQAAARLLTVLPDGDRLDAATRAAVLTAARGNPLYVYEYVRMLRDQRVSVGHREQLGVPATVQQAIIARVDTLNAPDRQLLQAAAVLGQVGWVGALAALTGQDRTQVEAGLGRLNRRELLRRVRDSSVAGETEYTFDHPLVRDVVYQRILRADKARSHQLAADWFSRLSGPHPTEPAAYHQQQADQLTVPPRDARASGCDSADETGAALTRHTKSRCA